MIIISNIGDGLDNIRLIIWNIRNTGPVLHGTLHTGNSYSDIRVCVCVCEWYICLCLKPWRSWKIIHLAVGFRFCIRIRKTWNGVSKQMTACFILVISWITSYISEFFSYNSCFARHYIYAWQDLKIKSYSLELEILTWTQHTFSSSSFVLTWYHLVKWNYWIWIGICDPFEKNWRITENNEVSLFIYTWKSLESKWLLLVSMWY